MILRITLERMENSSRKKKNDNKRNLKRKGDSTSKSLMDWIQRLLQSSEKN